VLGTFTSKLMLSVTICERQKMHELPAFSEKRDCIIEDLGLVFSSIRIIIVL